VSGGEIKKQRDRGIEGQRDTEAEKKDCGTEEEKEEEKGKGAQTGLPGT